MLHEWSFGFDVVPFLGHRKSPSAVCCHHFTFEQRAWLLPLLAQGKREAHLLNQQTQAPCQLPVVFWMFFLQTQGLLGRFGSSPFRVFLLRCLRFLPWGISTVARTVVSLRRFRKVCPNVPLEKMHTTTNTFCLGILSGDESRWKREKKMQGLFCKRQLEFACV